MGKWTPDYLDDVLHSKIKTLVSGAINRSALEKTEPTISYENFVKELDTGDSFTTSIIDILVKELAERRTRPTLNDRRLIADRSAKSLRLLATPLRIYRDRTMGRYHPSRRTAHLSGYLSAPPLEMDMEEDEDIFESMLDDGTSIEGVRVNTDLYEAYSHHVPVSRVRSPSPPPPPPPVEDAPPSPAESTSYSSYSRSGPWSFSDSIPPPANTITRQASIRRPIRSRTVDFNDFTHRRRSSTRDLHNSRAESSETPDSREGSWTRNSQSTRRFFPFVRTRRHESADNNAWASDISGSHSADIDDERNPYFPVNSFTAPWFNLTPPTHREPATMEEVLADAALSDERARSATPRLRRGGLRAPESVLSRHASPISAIPLENVLRLDGPLSPPRELDNPDIAGETGYPTPSTEHDFLS